MKRARIILACLSVAHLACASSSGPSAAVGEASIRLVSVDASAASLPAEVSSALRVHADRQLPGCLERAREAGSSGLGHMDLSVSVDAEGGTMAAVLHATMSDYQITECVARALSGAVVPTRGESYKVRVKVETGS